MRPLSNSKQNIRFKCLKRRTQTDIVSGPSLFVRDHCPNNEYSNKKNKQKKNTLKRKKKKTANCTMSDTSVQIYNLVNFQKEIMILSYRTQTKKKKKTTTKNKNNPPQKKQKNPNNNNKKTQNKTNRKANKTKQNTIFSLCSTVPKQTPDSLRYWL